MEQTIPRLVQGAAQRFGDAVAVEDGDIRLSFSNLHAAALRACRAFCAAGIAPGDRVGIWAPNSVEWIVAAIGLQSAGAVLVTLSTRFKGTEAAYVLRKETIGLILVLLAECLGLWLLLNRTTLGLKLRAVASNPDSARLHGIKAGSMLMLGWAMSAALGAIAGSLVAAERTGFDASLMQTILVFALASAALGGFDSIWGAVISGMVVGVADALTIQYVDPLDGIEVVLPLALILVILVVMPNGLFGKRTVERV
jgi:branched-subunit amino acid ABC-type transport system permease component